MGGSKELKIIEHRSEGIESIAVRGEVAILLSIEKLEITHQLA